MRALQVGSNAGIFVVLVDNGNGFEYVDTVDAYAEDEAWDAVVTTRVSSSNFVITLALAGAGSSNPSSSDSLVYFVGATVRGLASSTPSYTPSPVPSIIPSTYMPPGAVGAVTTIAGGAGAPQNFGVNDGVGTAASFAAPAAITLGPRNEYALVVSSRARMVRRGPGLRDPPPSRSPPVCSWTASRTSSERSTHQLASSPSSPASSA